MMVVNYCQQVSTSIFGAVAGAGLGSQKGNMITLVPIDLSKKPFISTQTDLPLVCLLV
jgi:hypothetical protein